MAVCLFKGLLVNPSNLRIDMEIVPSEISQFGNGMDGAFLLNTEAISLKKVW
jgi:hypothetical protein